MNTLIILSVINIFVMILILLAINAIGVGLKIHKMSGTNPNQNVSETQEFRAGMNHAFHLVQMCLYKMWNTNDILDFDNINESIKENLLTITNSKENFKIWFNKYNEYLKSKGTTPPDADF